VNHFPRDGDWLCLSTDVVVDLRRVVAVSREGGGVTVHTASSDKGPGAIRLDSGEQADIIWDQFAGPNPIVEDWLLVLEDQAINLRWVEAVVRSPAGVELQVSGVTARVLLPHGPTTAELFRRFFQAGNKTALLTPRNL